MTRAMESRAGVIGGVIDPVPQIGGLQGLRMLELADLPRWKLALEQGRPSGFGCYFPYVFAHQRPGRSAVLVAEDAGCLCTFILRDDERGPHLDLFLAPIPMDVAVAARCLERANDFNGDRSARILRIDANDAALAATILGLSVRERRAQYLYAPRAFGDLRGGEYRTLRRNVAKIRRLPDLEVVPYSERFAGDCRTLLQRWSERHLAAFGTWGGTGTSARALDLADVLPAPDLAGEVILLGGRLVAFAFGGELRAGLGCFLEAKCDLDVPGLTYFQRHSFLSKLDAFELVNDGSDARRAGIRQVKDSLRPAAMHVEYRGSQVASRARTAPVAEARPPIRFGRDTTHVGVLCNVDRHADPREQLSPSVINRAYLIDELLAPAGIRIFLYSPKDVASTGDAPGYVLEERTPVAVRRPVPLVNANWSYSTRRLLRQGMGYQPFKRWLRERGIEVYVPYEFSELVSNKQQTYEVVRAWDPSLHPHTEDFLATPAQIESFLARSKTVFLKPRAGHKGNRIFVLRRSGGGYSLEYYDSRARRSFPRISLEAVLALVDAATGRERYVVQEGIESLRHEGAVFDVRVVMVNDGRGWHALLESRLAPPGSELSNVYQGGTIRVTGELLSSAVGERESRVLEERLRQVSHGLVGHFESRFPGALSEIGFDFVLDQDRAPRLVEVNAKPGIAGIGSERRLFDWAPEERPLHEMWTFPHMVRLAGFLRHKIEAARPALEPAT